MKKVISIALVMLVGIIVAAPSRPAEAQVVYSRNCCDSNAVIRCFTVNWTPLGNACVCPGIPGIGYMC
jgi:hypothetical protein